VDAAGGRSRKGCIKRKKALPRGQVNRTDRRATKQEEDENRSSSKARSEGIHRASEGR